MAALAGRKIGATKKKLRKKYKVCSGVLIHLQFCKM